MPLERDAMLAYVGSGWKLPEGAPIGGSLEGNGDPALVDVGAKVREITAAFLKVEPNRATPRDLLGLVRGLEGLTQKLYDAAAQVDIGTMGMPTLPPDEARWWRDFRRWRERLEGYRKACEAAAPNDRAAVLWTVTAPLLLGYYNGEESDKPQQVADVASPFMLENQLNVREEWREENWQRFVEDLKRPPLVPPGVKWWHLAVAGLGIFLLAKLR